MKRILILGDRTGVSEALGSNLSHAEFHKIYELQQQFAKSKLNGAYDAIGWCPEPGKLTEQVAELAGPHTVELLDIVDHGAPGIIRCGNAHLFELIVKKCKSELLNDSILQELRGLMSFGASLRLLGCKTGLAPEGRALLRRMARVSDFSLRIYGTISRVQVVHFLRPGFSGAPNELFSSESAIDTEAPTWGQRETNLGQS